MFEAMGGEGSMAKLVHAKPSMANYDYTHINFRGGKHLAGLLYETLIYGKEQYDRRRAYEKNSCCPSFVLVLAGIFVCSVVLFRGDGARPYPRLSSIEQGAERRPNLCGK